MDDKKTIHKELVKSFFLAFKRLTLYSPEHPLSKEILTNLFKMFTTLLKENPEILLTVGLKTDELLVNNKLMDKDILGVPDLYERFKRYQIDEVGFTAGLTTQELVDFIRAMVKAATLDGGKQVPLPTLLKDGSQHIKIKRFRYEKVEEGQKIISEEELEVGGKGPGLGPGLGGGPGGAGEGSGGGDGPGGGVVFKDAFVDIKDFLIGKSGDISGGVEGVMGVLDKEVDKVASTIVESAKESGDLEGVIKKFISWLSKHVAPVVVEKKKDPVRFIQKLFDSFQKEELGVHFSNAESIIEGCADDIKLAMVEEAFSIQKASPKKAINTALKILSDEEDQERILPKLSQHLVAKGVSAEEAGSFVQKVKLELAKDEEVAISKKKLQKLMKISEKYEWEVDHRVKKATEELTRKNRRLSDEKERSDEIMRHVADGLVVVDNNGKVVMINPAAEKLLGKEMKEAVGKSLAESMKEEHLLAVAKGPLADKDETHITKEIEVNSKDETTKRVLRASSAVVENEDGKTVGMVSILSDITHEKEVEEMKSHFVSLVTHELRTPIVAIQKSLELILSKTTGAINEDQERFLSISKLNLERLNKLVNDLLDMSKLEAGKLMLIPASFDFRGVVQEVKASLSSWADDKQITIHLDVKDQPATVTADRDRLLQVLVNLIGNAIKFTPEKGEVTISLNLLEKREGVCEEPCLEVVVADTGIGIDPKDFKRIFNKFEQVSLVAPTGVGGSGLGLPISKEIIGLHGGSIWVESQKGHGSRFIFVVPRQFKGSKK